MLRAVAISLLWCVPLPAAAQLGGKEQLKEGRGEGAGIVGAQIPEEAQKAIQGVTAQTVAQLVQTLIYCSVAILAFAGLCIGIIAWLVHSDKVSADRAFQFMGLVTIIGFGVFLVVAGYGQNQMSAIMGLLGSALGYLFGKDWSAEKRPESAGK